MTQATGSVERSLFFFGALNRMIQKEDGRYAASGRTSSFFISQWAMTTSGARCRAS